jgi:ABC-type Fe3+ transport system permease subunit
MLARVIGLFAALRAVLAVATTLGLALFLAKQGWSMERVQFLGFIWPGVVLALGLIVWVNASMARVRERTPIAALRHRQFS